MSDPSAPAMTPLRRLKNILGGSAGNFVEWFDWFAYASFAIYFSRAFFPEGTQTVQLLQTAFIFAGGFVARPLGALLLGIYADRVGRRAALTLSVAMMCGGSLLIALIPTGLGVVSPLLLVLARLLQGLSVGGEYGASATYVSEMAGKHHRGFWSGFLYVTLIGGQLAAIAAVVVAATADRSTDVRLGLAGFDKPAVTQLMVWVLATFLFLPPLAGWISDHFGRKRTLAVSFGMSALLAVPVLTAISTATDLVSVYLLCVTPLVALSGYTALSAIIKAELYPAHIRALGVALPYSLAMAVFGGNAEATALHFKNIGHESGYFWLVAAIFAVGFVVAATMRDTREHTRIEED